MKRIFWLIPLLVGMALLVGWLTNVETTSERLLAAPPLSLDGFMDEVVPEATEKEELAVDNSQCYVCHGNFDGESLVVEHGKEAIGCVDCHGPSSDHCNDENHEIPPDKMYDPKDVDNMCGDCHDMHDVAAVDVIAKWQERCPKKTNPDDIICTDCHYEHRLPFRTVWWDRETRKMIIREEGQRTKQAEDLTEVPEQE